MNVMPLSIWQDDETMICKVGGKRTTADRTG